jgi:hypothetical protein
VRRLAAALLRPGLPGERLMRRLFLLALVCGIFPPTPKLFESGINKSS